MSTPVLFSFNKMYNFTWIHFPFASPLLATKKKMNKLELACCGKWEQQVGPINGRPSEIADVN